MLNELKIKSAKPKEKRYRIMDSDGLVLEITPGGKKYWRFRYHFNNVEKMISLGLYPDMSLADARETRNEQRKLLRQGTNPADLKKKVAPPPVTMTFATITQEWMEQYSAQWSAHHAARLMRRFETDVFPALGDRPVAEITAKDVLAVLRQVQPRSLEIAHRIKIACSQVFRYAVATGHTDRDPVADLRGAMPPTKDKHFAAPTDPKEIGPLLRAVDGYAGSFIVKCALKLGILTFVRPGELRKAEWAEIDLDKSLWHIPAERMKMKIAHLVPLSSQALTVLKELRELTDHSRFCFPCHRTPLRCMSDNAVNAALRRMGYERTEIVGHGFRAMARTVIDEVLQVRPDYIEHQLAHAVKDPNGRAYNRTTFLPERTAMMQQWADYLDHLKVTDQPISFSR